MPERNIMVLAVLNQGGGWIDWSQPCRYNFRMRTGSILRAFGMVFCAGTLVLAGCSTPERRISDHPEIFQNLSPKDQALVSHGQIRSGMSENAVWLAWGSADQKAVGDMRGRATETWVYYMTTTAPYYGHGSPYWGGGYGY